MDNLILFKRSKFCDNSCTEKNHFASVCNQRAQSSVQIEQNSDSRSGKPRNVHEVKAESNGSEESDEFLYYTTKAVGSVNSDKCNRTSKLNGNFVDAETEY